MKIVLCLLTYNELPCLQILFPRIPMAGGKAGYDEIIAIDGGSTDGTIEFFKANKIPIIAQSRKGRGDAFQQAFAKIDADAYIFFSPDGNEDVEDLPRFCWLEETNGNPLVPMLLSWQKRSHNPR